MEFEQVKSTSKMEKSHILNKRENDQWIFDF